jgi:hypothetical protein
MLMPARGCGRVFVISCRHCEPGEAIFLLSLRIFLGKCKMGGKIIWKQEEEDNNEKRV